MHLGSRTALKSGGRPPVAVYSHPDLGTCQDITFSLLLLFYNRNQRCTKTENVNIHLCSSTQCSRQQEERHSTSPVFHPQIHLEQQMCIWLLTTQLNVNKLATALLLLCVWGADSADHFIHKRLYKNNRKFYFTGSV